KKSVLIARFGLAIVCACCFMTSLDRSIVNVALPIMTNTLHVPFSQITWVVDGYLLMYAGLAIPAGRLADILGQRRVFVAGLVLFTLASAVCGFSTNALLLIGARLLQGTGGACITAPSLVLLTSVVPTERRGAALGLCASMIALAGVVGPVAGGFIISTLGTGWIFFINVPIGLLLVAATLVVLPQMKIEKPHHFDSVGVILATLGLSSIIFAVVEGPTYNWGTIVGPLNIMYFLVGGLLLLVIFAFWERTQSEPFLPLSFFKNWPFTCMVTINVLLSFASLGVVFVMTLYLESAVGMSALLAGLTLIPQALAVLIVSPLAGRVYDKVGSTPVLVGGLLCFALGTGLLAWVSNTDSNWLTLLLPLVLAGSGLACAISPVLGEALRSVKRPMMGTASGVISTTRLVGGAIGVAVTYSFLQSHLVSVFNSQVASAVQQAPAGQRQAFVAYLHALMQSITVTHTPLSLSLQHIAQQIYAESFVTALRPTLIMTVCLLLIAVLLALSVPVVATWKKDSQPSTSSGEAARNPQPAQSAS
ncbi:MAG TPA: DHA2 family efflux MFS transporter permease subunit, partial [Ktedonobacteraceae bacterium]|nr:DHA2 family efflux MFS transporter permease subunit [Ktedonobacteraceae bacterium]